MIDINALDIWLNQHPTIPSMPSNPRTLMDIMGIRHLENPWSDLYAFFLSEREEHEFGDVFIRSLETIMGLPTEWITPTEIVREKVTNEGKRIDILLIDDIHKRAIIIENKVFHAPINPFSQYIEDIQGKGYKVKVVILAPYKVTNANKDRFDNLKGIDTSITHEEYMKEVQQRLNSDHRGNSFYRRILDHFIQNIKNITNMVTSEQLKFFYSHYGELHAINDLFSSIEKGYKDALQKIEFGDDVEVDVEKKFYSNADSSWLYLPYKKNRAVCLTVFLLPNQQLRIILELRGKETIKNINKTELIKLVDSTQEVQREGLVKEKDFWHVAEFYSSPGIDLNPIKLQDILQKYVIYSPIYKLGLQVINLCSVLAPSESEVPLFSS